MSSFHQNVQGSSKGTGLDLYSQQNRTQNQSMGLPIEILEMIFDKIEQSELFIIRGTCSTWNTSALEVIKLKKIDDYLIFFNFLKENLSNYPNESKNIDRDLRILKKCRSMDTKKIIPFFNDISYNLGSMIAGRLLNIRIIDLNNLMILSENVVTPQCKKMLSVVEIFQQIKFEQLLGNFEHIREGMTEDEIGDFEWEQITINERALVLDRYDIGIDEAISFSSLPILQAKECPDSFTENWTQANLIFQHIRNNGVNPILDFTLIEGTSEVSYFNKLALICQKAVTESKFNRLLSAVKEKQEIIGTLFIIRYLEYMGENDKSLQIKALLKPGTMQFADTEKTELSDFFTSYWEKEVAKEERAERIAHLGKRDRKEESFDELSPKKPKIDNDL